MKLQIFRNSDIVELNTDLNAFIHDGDLRTIKTINTVFNSDSGEYVVFVYFYGQSL